MEGPSFHYRMACSEPNCERPSRYKVAAPWSYGPLRELKNYGLACDEHLEALLGRARRNREILAVGDDETVGPVEVYTLVPGRRDFQLPRRTEPER